MLRPNNKCVLDDTVPMKERILMPACSLAPNLMMEDIGIASPLYDLCMTLGIRDLYKLPIQLIPWPVPYPIGVAWPVIEYGVDLDAENVVEEGGRGEEVQEREREKGYIIVSAGGKVLSFVYFSMPRDAFDASYSSLKFFSSSLE